MGLNAGAHAREVSRQPRVVEAVALARCDGGVRGAVGHGAFLRIEPAQCGSPFLPLRRGLGMDDRRQARQKDRREKKRRATMVGVQPC